MTASPYVDYATTGRPAPSRRNSSRARRIADWTLRGLLAIAFVGAGATKFMGVEQSVAVFQVIETRFGVGMWFMWLAAILEIGGGLLILQPRFARPAALLLAAVSLGALLTNLFVVPSPPVAGALLLMCLAVLWSHRPRAA